MLNLYETCRLAKHCQADVEKVPPPTIDSVKETMPPPDRRPSESDLNVYNASCAHGHERLLKATAPMSGMILRMHCRRVKNVLRGGST